MYYPDLSLSQPAANWPVQTYVGWLEPPNPYTQGTTSSTFRERLLLFCSHPTFFTMGIHECPYCDDLSVQRYSFPDGTYLHFGSVPVWVFGKMGRIYVAPGLIYHYVVAHHYSPPQEFIQAVMRCPDPTSATYQQRIQRILKRSKMEGRDSKSPISRLVQWWQRYTKARDDSR